jgi:hypothetical protein
VGGPWTAADASGEEWVHETRSDRGLPHEFGMPNPIADSYRGAWAQSSEQDVFG